MLTHSPSSAPTPSSPCGLQPAPAVNRACRLLVENARAQASGTTPIRAEVVSTERRPDSTIHVIRLATGNSAHRFYLKTLHSTPATRWSRLRAITAEYSLLAQLQERFAPITHLGVVHAIACFPDELSLLTEEFPGRTLDAVLAGAWMPKSRRWLDRAAHLCWLTGEWLGHFQSFTAPSRPSMFDLSELFIYCNERLGIILGSARGGLDTPTATLIRRRLRELGRAVSSSELEAVGRHNDFRPENILTDGQRVALLDFTGFTYGPRLCDFMKFWMKLEDLTARPFLPGRATAALQQAFLQGYGAMVDPRSPLAQLLRVANVLDKLSEAVDPDLPPPPLCHRPAMTYWYRAQRRWLGQFLHGDHRL